MATEDPVEIKQIAGELSAQKVEIHLGERSMAMLSRMAFVAGICATVALVSLIGLWAVYTQTQIIKDGYNRVRVRLEALEQKEQGNAVQPERS